MSTPEQIVQHLKLRLRIDQIIAFRGLPTWAGLAPDQKEALRVEQADKEAQANVFESTMYAGRYHPATEETLAGQSEELIAFWRKRFAKK